MANTFLGFPVSRAKIADIVLQNAPPALHHTQHEDGGSDEIDATGLVGAGGGALPWTDLLFDIIFFALDTAFVYTASGGTVTFVKSYVRLNTGGTTGAIANINITGERLISPIDFSKASQFSTRARFDCDGDKLATYILGVGRPMLDDQYGFYVEEGVLYGFSGPAASPEYLALETLGAAAYDQIRKLRAVFSPGVEVRFYVNDVDKGAITAALPSGAPTLSSLIYLNALNPSEIYDKKLDVFHWRFWQAA